MSIHPVSEEAPETALFIDDIIPKWDPKKELFRTRRWVRFLIVIMLIIWFGLAVWVLFVAPIIDATPAPLEVGAGVALVLLPILVIALVIEQILEAILAIVENKWQTLVAYLGYGLSWLFNAQTELFEARKLLSEVSNAARNIQLDLPTSVWLKEMREQHSQGDLEGNEEKILAKEPILRLPDESLSELRQTITRLFSEQDLRTLCFDVGVDYDDLAGETKESKVRELILHQYRRGLLRNLIVKCAERRADIHWRNLAEKSQGGETEIVSFEKLFASVLDRAQEQSDLVNTMYAIAKKRVADAEREYEGGVTAPGYKRSKSVACVILGLMLGVIITALSQLQLFSLLGIGVVPPRIDVLFTGVVIGALTRPIHLLLQSFQHIVTKLSR
jgi:hypothetical protein